VSLRWAGGTLRAAEVRNDRAGDVKVRSEAKTATFSVKAGESIKLDRRLAPTAE
jgi:hypothetical protein